MPGIEDWRITPLRNISQIFEEHIRISSEGGGDNTNPWTKKVGDFFVSRLNLDSSDGEWRKQIPSLNVIPNHHLIDGQLVRFRGMIQVRLVKKF